MFVVEKLRIKPLELLVGIAAVPRRKHRPAVRSTRCEADIMIKLVCVVVQVVKGDVGESRVPPAKIIPG